jgi:hypothetical protein
MMWPFTLFKKKKAEAKVIEPPPRLAYVAPKGAMWNPLLSYPRNNKCWCGSLQKAKHCCMPRASKCVSIGTGEMIKREWNKILAGRYILPQAPRNFVKKGNSHE